MAKTPNAAVLERQSQAISLYGEGCSYDEIAEQLGYANRGSAWKTVNRGLRSQRDLRAGDYLQTQIDRYERVLATSWERATTGHDWKAANIVLRTLEQLDKVLRLGDGERAVSRESVLISANPEAYVAQLQEVVEEREHRARTGR